MSIRAGDGEAKRVAFHEAGHALAAVVLFGGASVGPVSIVPGASYGGVTVATLPRRPAEDPVARLHDEHEAIFALAGDIAEELALITGRLETGPQALASRTIRTTLSRAPMSLDDAEAIERAAAQPATDVTVTSDEDRWWDAVRRLDPGDVDAQIAHLRYLRLRTRTLLQNRWSSLESVVAGLLEARTIGGMAAALLIAEAAS